MIQRIQTLWLVLASACSFLTLRLSFYSGNKLVNGQQGFVHLTAANADNLILLVLTVAAALGSLISIFLFTNRSLQRNIVIATLAVCILNIVLFFMETRKFMLNQGNYDLTAVFAFLPPIFLILALRGIYKDQKLIKSLDRLR